MYINVIVTSKNLLLIIIIVPNACVYVISKWYHSLD